MRAMMGPSRACVAAAGLVGKRGAPLAGRRSMATKVAAEEMSLVGADQSNATQRLFHTTSLVCLALTPVALIAHPSPLSMPLDLALAVVFPIHGHIGINWILTDYVKAATPKGPIRMGLLGVTVLTILGLLKLSVTGEGLVGALKATWKDPEELKKKKDDKAE